MKKIFSKLICFSMAAVMSIAAYGCGGNQKSGDKLSQVKSNGKLVLGLSADFPPYEFLDITSGEPKIAGFDILIAEEICKDLGVELEIKDMDFDGLIAAMNADQIDIIISGMNATEKRKQEVLFSDEYFYADQCALIRVGDEAKYTTIEDFAGLKVGAQTGSIQEGVMNDQFVPAGAEPFTIKKVPNIVLELKSGRIECVILDRPIAEAFVRQHSDLVISSVVIQGDDSGFAVAMPLGEETLAAEINKTLKRLTDEAKIDTYFTEAVDLAEKQEVE